MTKIKRVARTLAANSIPNKMDPTLASSRVLTDLKSPQTPNCFDFLAINSLRKPPELIINGVIVTAKL